MIDPAKDKQLLESMAESGRIPFNVRFPANLPALEQIFEVLSRNSTYLAVQKSHESTPAVKFRESRQSQAAETQIKAQYLRRISEALGRPVVEVRLAGAFNSGILIHRGSVKGGDSDEGGSGTASSDLLIFRSTGNPRRGRSVLMTLRSLCAAQGLFDASTNRFLKGDDLDRALSIRNELLLKTDWTQHPDGPEGVLRRAYQRFAAIDEMAAVGRAGVGAYLREVDFLGETIQLHRAHSGSGISFSHGKLANDDPHHAYFGIGGEPLFIVPLQDGNPDIGNCEAMWRDPCNGRVHIVDGRDNSVIDGFPYAKQRGLLAAAENGWGIATSRGNPLLGELARRVCAQFEQIKADGCYQKDDVLPRSTRSRDWGIAHLMKRVEETQEVWEHHRTLKGLSTAVPRVANFRWADINWTRFDFGWVTILESCIEGVGTYAVATDGLKMVRGWSRDDFVGKDGFIGRFYRNNSGHEDQQAWYARVDSVLGVVSKLTPAQQYILRQIHGGIENRPYSKDYIEARVRDSMTEGVGVDCASILYQVTERIGILESCLPSSTKIVNLSVINGRNVRGVDIEKAYERSIITTFPHSPDGTDLSENSLWCQRIRRFLPVPHGCRNEIEQRHEMLARGLEELGGNPAGIVHYFGKTADFTVYPLGKGLCLLEPHVSETASIIIRTESLERFRLMERGQAATSRLKVAKLDHAQHTLAAWWHALSAQVESCKRKY